MNYSLGNMLGKRMALGANVESIAIFGDSITAQNSFLSGSLLYRSPSGYAVNAQRLLDGAFQLVKKVSTASPDGIDEDFGYGAFSASDLLDGKDGVYPMDDIAAANPKNVFVFCGSNGVAGAGTTDAIISIWDTFRAAGRKVFAGEILPRCVGASGYGDTQLAATYANNATLKIAAAARGIPWIEWASAMALSPGGYGDPILMPDFVHPGIKGAQVMGELFADFLAPYVGGSFPIPADGSSDWATGNPYMAGNVSGYATGYTSNAAFTGTKITDGDGTVWQRITVNALDTAEKVFRHTSGTSGTFANGDIVVPCVRIRAVEDGWDLKIVQVSLYQNEGAGVARVRAGNFVTNVSAVDATACSPLNGVILGPPSLITSSTTGLFIYLSTRGIGTGSFDIRQMGAIKIN